MLATSRLSSWSTRIWSGIFLSRSRYPSHPIRIRSSARNTRSQHRYFLFLFILRHILCNFLIQASPHSLLIAFRNWSRGLTWFGWIVSIYLDFFNYFSPLKKLLLLFDLVEIFFMSIFWVVWSIKLFIVINSCVQKR